MAYVQLNMPGSDLERRAHLLLAQLENAELTEADPEGEEGAQIWSPNQIPLANNCGQGLPAFADWQGQTFELQFPYLTALVPAPVPALKPTPDLEPAPVPTPAPELEPTQVLSLAPSPAPEHASALAPVLAPSLASELESEVRLARVSSPTLELESALRPAQVPSPATDLEFSQLPAQVPSPALEPQSAASLSSGDEPVATSTPALELEVALLQTFDLEAAGSVAELAWPSPGAVENGLPEQPHILTFPADLVAEQFTLMDAVRTLHGHASLTPQPSTPIAPGLWALGLVSTLAICPCGHAPRCS